MGVFSSLASAIIGVQSALGGRGGGLRYLLRDEFTTDRAAGAVNGTAAEPGPGTRVVVDPRNNISISGDKLVVSSPNAWDTTYSLGSSLARAAGRLCVWDFYLFPGESALSFGAGDWGDGVLSGSQNVRTWTPEIVVGSWSENENNQLAIALRSTGLLIFVKNSVYSNKWTLLWIDSTRTTSSVSPFIAVATASLYVYVGVPNTLWLPTPLLSDGFGSAFGTSDGLGHAEGLAGGIGAGGSGVTLSNAGGTWSVSGGKAINTAPSGLVQQISVANLSCADVYAGVAMTRALLTNVGLALNFDSASSPANGLLIYSDGAGNIKVDKIVSGSTTNVSTTAYTYSAGARLVCTMNAGALRVYYNGALITTATIVDAGILTGTMSGLFSTDASNTLDDLTIYATGTGGEYSQLDSY